MQKGYHDLSIDYQNALAEAIRRAKAYTEQCDSIAMLSELEDALEYLLTDDDIEIYNGATHLDTTNLDTIFEALDVMLGVGEWEMLLWGARKGTHPFSVELRLRCEDV